MLDVEEPGSLLEAQVLVEAWRIGYNTYRPHSSLDDFTTTEFAQRRITNNHSPLAHSSWTT